MRLPEGEVRENTEILSTRAWKIAEVLEQRFPGWDSRRYIIAMLIYRYLSQEMEQFAEDQPELVLHQKRYRTMDDEEAEALTGEASSAIGFFIPPSGLFCNVYRDAQEMGILARPWNGFSPILRNQRSDTQVRASSGTSQVILLKMKLNWVLFPEQESRSYTA